MRPNTPQITKKANTRVLTITTIGNPNTTAQSAIPALYGTAYGTKFKVFKPKGKNMVIGCLACRWPDAHLKPKSKWTGIWGLEVPAFVISKVLLQKDPKHRIVAASWKYGTVAEILHIGSYTSEGPTVKKLHHYIEEKGYELAGPHEEVYLTRPGVKVQKTLIRYQIRKRKK